MSARLRQLSLVLNVALLAAWAWRHSSQPAAPVVEPPTPTVLTVTQTNVPTATPAPASVTLTNIVRPAFHWSQVESADLRQYRDRLRAIGCPEKTLRDILTGEVDFIFGRRRRDLLVPAQQQFWSLLAAGESGIKPFVEAIEKMGEERKALLDELLGGENEDDTASDEVYWQSVMRRIDYLPPEKREQIVELENRYRDLRSEVAKKFPGTDPEAQKARGVRYTELKQQQLAEQKQLLTPGEFDEFRLRGSSVARWSESLPGFDPTPEQQRAVALARLPFTDPIDPNAPDAKELTKARDAARAKFEKDGLREILGREGFAAYQLASDPVFQQLDLVASRLELPPETAATAWQFQKSATQQAARVRNDGTLTEEQKAVTLAAIQQETLRTFQRTLGERGLSVYQKHGGDWLEALGSVSPAIMKNER